MRIFEELFKNKKQNTEKMFAYGFVKKDKEAIYETNILGGAFSLAVSISENGDMETNLTDIENGEPYVLYKTNAVGAYVGEIRAAVRDVLGDIANMCYDFGVFRTRQAEMIIKYIRDKYGDELEFLWPKFPVTAVWRRKDSRKWYGIISAVNGRKIGLDADKAVEIIDLRMRAEDSDHILAKQNYYPGWHMNKRSWYTLVLDNETADEEIKQRIAESFELARK